MHDTRDSIEDDLRTLAMCLNGTLVNSQVAKRAGKHRSTVGRWVDEIKALAEQIRDRRDRLAAVMLEEYPRLRSLITKTEQAEAGKIPTCAALPPVDLAKLQNALVIGQEMVGLASRLRDLIRKMQPPGAEDFLLDLREAIEELYDLALLSKPRIDRALLLIPERE